MIFWTVALIFSLVAVAMAESEDAFAEINWRQLPDMPVPISGLNMAWIDGKLVVANGATWVGGTTQYRGTLADQFIEYDPQTDSWSNIPMSPTGVAWTGSVSADNSLYVFGGLLDNSEECTASSYRLTHDANGYQWNQIQSLPNTWWAASGDSTALIGSKAYLVGGAYSGDVADFTNDLLIADLNGNSVSYSYGSAIPGPARYAIAAGAVSGKVYAFGGNSINPREDNVRAESYCYDPQSDQWTQIADLPLKRYGAAAVGLDDRYLAVIGGYSLTREERSTLPATDGFLSDVLIYDTQENTYTQSTPLPIQQLYGGDYQGILDPTVLKVGDDIYVVGGERSRSRNFVPTVHSGAEPVPPPPGYTTKSCDVIADASVWSANSTWNRGAFHRTDTRGDSAGMEMRGFIKFDLDMEWLESLDPEQILAVTFKGNGWSIVDPPAAGEKLEVVLITESDWVEGIQTDAAPGPEGGVTWRTSDGTTPWAIPGQPGGITCISRGWPIGSAWEVDATDLLMAWRDGAPNYGVYITRSGMVGDSQTYASFNSRESGLPTPELFIEYIHIPMTGDVNDDGFVGGADLNIILSNWGLNDATREQGDLTGDGTVGGADYAEVLEYWGQGSPPEPNSIPEPATLILLTFGSLVLWYPKLILSTDCLRKVYIYA